MKGSQSVTEDPIDPIVSEPSAPRRSRQFLGRRHTAGITRGGVAAEVVRQLKALPLVPALILLLIVGGFVSPEFLTKSNMLVVLQQASELGVVVIGETLVLLVGKFDLSLQSTFGLAPMVGGALLVSKINSGFGTDLPTAIGILVVLLIGLGIGLANGVMIVKFRLNAFVVTLAMLVLLQGLQLGVVGGATLYNLPNAFIYMGSATWAGVPASVWTMIILYVAFGAFLRYHRVGRSLYATGGNREAARAAGVRVDRITIGAFAMASVLAAFGGLLQSGRIASVTSIQGSNLIFQVFAAAVIGGISLNGGKGRLAGAFCGVLLLALITNLLTLAQVNVFWVTASSGAVILLALISARITGGADEV